MKHKPNILFYYYYYENYTGGAMSMGNLVRSVDKTRINPIFGSQIESEMSKDLGEQVDILIHKLPNRLQQTNSAALNTSLFGKIIWAKDVLKANLSFKKIIKNNDIELVICRGSRSVLLLGFGCKLKNIPLVWDIALEKKSYGFMRLIHRIAFSLSSKVITEAKSQHDFIFNSLASKYSHKLGVIETSLRQNIIDRALKTHTLRKEKTKEKFKCLIPATIDPRKNQFEAIKAVNKLKDQGINIYIDFAGPVVDENYFSELKKYIKENDLEDHFQFLGWRDDVIEILAHYTILLLVSKNEGVPRAIIEAMFAGVPVVATEVGGIPDVVVPNKTGILIQSPESSAISTALKQAFDNPDQLVAFSKEAHIQALKRFTPEVEAKQYEDLFFELLESK